jgi:hypothetical protein
MRWRWAALVGLASMAALSGCYYDPYTGYFYPYPTPYPYGAPPSFYPYGNPPPASYGAPPPENAPVQQAPLPPPR